MDIEVIHKDLVELKREFEIIKRALLYEGKLTPWAKKSLAVARSESKDSYTSLESL